MSYIGEGAQLTSGEVLMIQNLRALANSSSTQAIQKTATNTFAQVSVGSGSGTWTGPEQLTLAADSKTFTLTAAPNSIVILYSGHQPQLYGVDFTGAINGVNKIFTYVAAQDASLLTDQYALYQ